jgi:glutathione S-transferase
MKLVVANKNYSSWSLRAWLVLRHFAVAFDEELARLDGEGWKAHLNAISPTGRVPVLIDGDLVIPDSLAIIEYVAEKFPDVPVWPADPAARAQARALAAEMHAGFHALRAAAPMNLRAALPGCVELGAIAADLRRIEAIWSAYPARSGGPFLFGEFCAADAMYAPVATRLETYAIAASPAARAYMDAIFALPAFVEWKTAALDEPWFVEMDEIYADAGGAAP